MVGTRNSARKIETDEKDCYKTAKTPVVIEIRKADLPESFRLQLNSTNKAVSRPKLRESSDSASNESITTSRYPIRSSTLKAKIKLNTLKPISKDLDFLKNKASPIITWKGPAEIKYTKAGTDLKFFKKAIWDSESLKSGDIVRLVTNSGEIYGQITYLFEENTHKSAEIRLIYPYREQYLETYEYSFIHLSNIFGKVDFTSSNGYSCKYLQEKSGNHVKVSGKTRLERSLLRSKLTLHLCNNNNSLHHAIALLTLSSTPSTLIGRSQEKEEILDFLTTSLSLGHSSSSLYICGMPGTGKTATFLHSIDYLAQSKSFDFIHINCMKLSKPQEIYNLICAELFSKKKSGHEALELINLYVKKANKKHCVVLLVDELDALLNRKQDVLYNLFNWTSDPNSNFIVTGIANTMDLSDKFIHKVSSRMGNRQIVFAPYSRDQLQEIITKRLKETNSFTAEAILFCAAKIASYSGDARRAFQVCKKAAFLALEQKEAKIGIEHIQKAFKQLFTSTYVQAIGMLPLYMKLLLSSLCLELKNNNKESAEVDRLYYRLNSYCDTLLNIKTLSLKQVEVIASRLASFRLISLNSGIVKLLVTPDDVILGIKADPILSKIESFLQGN